MEEEEVVVVVYIHGSRLGLGLEAHGVFCLYKVVGTSHKY